MRKLVALLAVVVVGAAGFALVGCGSESAVSLAGKPGTTAAATTSSGQTGSDPSQLSLEVWFAHDNGLVAVAGRTRRRSSSRPLRSMRCSTGRPPRSARPG